MESYVVRIYRRRKGTPEQIVGMVERVGAEDQVAFHGFEELARILAAESGTRMGRPHGRRGSEGEPSMARRKSTDSS